MRLGAGLKQNLHKLWLSCDNGRNMMMIIVATMMVIDCVGRQGRNNKIEFYANQFQAKKRFEKPFMYQNLRSHQYNELG